MHTLLDGSTKLFNHLAAFGLLMVVGATGWGLQTWLIVGVSALAAWLELAQFLSPGREPDLVQVAGSLAGILLGLIVARFWRMDRRST